MILDSWFFYLFFWRGGRRRRNLSFDDYICELNKWTHDLFGSCFDRQYRGNEGQMRELQDQLEAEQYFSVSESPTVQMSLLFSYCRLITRFLLLQTLYKTQVRELKEEIEERNRQVQDAQKKVHDLISERYVVNSCWCLLPLWESASEDFYLFIFCGAETRCLLSWIWRWPRPSLSSSLGLCRKSSTLNSARRARKQRLGTSRRSVNERPLLHRWG